MEPLNPGLSILPVNLYFYPLYSTKVKVIQNGFSLVELIGWIV
jgi:hypothetical protein